MTLEGFTCSRCQGLADQALAQRCPKCGGILVARYLSGDDAISRWTAEPSLWAYRSSLPIASASPLVTLGEGKTPLVPAPRLASRLGIGSLMLKLELVNPTGSFKDRALSVALTFASEHHARGVVGASSGNALHAQAAYAARAGLRSVALVPEGVSPSRLVQPIVCGTRVIRVRGDYSDCHRLARELACRMGWYNTSTTYENPVGVEGYKTVAYEIWETLRACPDWIAVPVGAGPLLGAAARGFEDLIHSRRITDHPALLGIQASRCAPITRAFDRHENAVSPWEGDSRSIARGIADPLRGYAEDGTYTLDWVRRTNGAMVAVSDEATASAMRELGETCGLHVDPAAAAAIAGIRAAVLRGYVRPDASVLAIVTGTGFKEDTSGSVDLGLMSVVEPDADGLAETLSREEEK